MDNSLKARLAVSVGVLGWFKLNWLARLVLFATVVFLVLYPLMMMLIGSFRTEMPGLPGTWGIAGWVEAYTDPTLISAIGTTVQIALSKTVIAVAAAVVIAWAVHRTNMPGRRMLDTWLHLNFFILPPMPILMGWMLIFAPKTGIVNKWFIDAFGFPLFNIYSVSGIVFVMLSGSISFYYMFLSPAFRSMDMTLEEASRMSGASGFTTLRRVVLPLLMPAILAVSMLSIIRGLEAFEGPLFLGSESGVNVLATKIFDYVHFEPSNYRAAIACGVTLLAITFLLILVQWKILGRRAFVTVTGRGYRPRLTDLGRWRWPIFIVLGLTLFSLTVPPFVILIQTTFMKVPGVYDLPEGIWTLRNYQKALSNPKVLAAVSNTVVLGLVVASAGTVICTLAAYVVVKTRYVERKVLDIVLWLPWAVPGIVMSLALLWAWIFIKPFGFTLYGSLPLLMICLIAIGFPIGTRIMSSTIVQISSELEESARVSGASWSRSVMHIWFPLVIHGFTSAWILSFVASVMVLAPVILIYSPQSRLISTIFYEFWSAGDAQAAGVIGLVQAGIIITAYTLVKLLGRLVGVKTEEA